MLSLLASYPVFWLLQALAGPTSVPQMWGVRVGLGHEIKQYEYAQQPSPDDHPPRRSGWVWVQTAHASGGRGVS